MELLKKRILKDGFVLEGQILKVDSFLNHQIDVELMWEMGKEFHRLFDDKITKVLTVEASGIAVASITALNYKVPMLFAKKGARKNSGNELYSAKSFSYTKGEPYELVVSKKYLNKDDKVLIIDDFLAHGMACTAMLDICKQAGAEVVGIGIVIEKSFQKGRSELEKTGIRIESLVRVASMSEGTIEFLNE